MPNADPPMESRFFPYRNHTAIHFATCGHGPVPLVFLHGFASDHATWLDMAGLFPPESYTLYFPDLKGFGKSAKPRDWAYSVEDQADVVTALIVELGLCSVSVVGHSMGGSIALMMAIRAGEGNLPFTLERMVLIDCAAYPQRIPKFFRRLRTPILGALFLRLVPSRLLVKGMLEKVFYDPGAVTPERFKRYRKYLKGRGNAHALRATVTAIDPAAYGRVAERYRDLRVPSLIVWGEEDRVVRVRNAYRLHGDLAGSRLKVLKKCGHNPQEERPRETFSAIDAFLQGDP